MKRWHILSLVIFLILLFSGCSEKNPLEITEYTADTPSAVPTITRSNLKTGNDYTIGYNSGNIRSDRVTLDWTINTDADFLCYKIFRKPEFQQWYGPDPVCTITTQTTGTHTDTSLTHDTVYDYKVAVLNISGLYQTDTVQVKTPLFLPPSALSGDVDTTSVTLTWLSNSESADDFFIQRIMDETDFDVVADSNIVEYTIGTTTYPDTTTVGHDYSYRVRAFNAYEATDWSSTETVSIN